MGKNVKLTSTRGLIAIGLTLAYITLCITGKDTTQFLPVYMLVIGYMFSRDDGDNTK